MALMPSESVVLVLELTKQLAQEGDNFDDRLRRVAEFLYSEPVLRAPKNHLAALLYAGLARRAVGGKKQPPSRGTANDIDVISAYLPHCDAIFIDDEFAQILREGPIDKEIARYPTRIFSARTRDGFLEYLRQLEADASSEHVALVAQTYGEDWVTPFRSILEHEREVDSRRQRRDVSDTASAE
jgi:hypothetical protein